MKSRNNLPLQTSVEERTSEMYSVRAILQEIPSTLIRGKFNDSRRDTGSNKKNSSECSESRNNRGNDNTSSKSSRDNNSKGNKHSRIRLGQTIPSDLTFHLAISQISRSMRVVKVSRMTSSTGYLEAMIHFRTFSVAGDPLLK